MAELADAADSKSADLRVLGVRLPLPAPTCNPFHQGNGGIGDFSCNYAHRRPREGGSAGLVTPFPSEKDPRKLSNNRESPRDGIFLTGGIAPCIVACHKSCVLG